MSELDNCFWFENEGLFDCTRKNTEKNNKGNLRTLILNTNSPLGLLLQSYPDWKVSQKSTFCTKPSQKHTTEYPDLFPTYLFREGFQNITRNKNLIVAVENLSFIQQSISSLLVFDSVKSKYFFPPLNDSDSFGKVDYDAQKNTKLEYSINRIFNFMTNEELNTRHHICALEGTQLLTLLARSM